MSDLIEELRSLEKAYPEDIFLLLTKDERDWLHTEHPGLIDRISAAMGRHLAKFIGQAASALSELKDNLEREQGVREDAQRQLRSLEAAAAKVPELKLTTHPRGVMRDVSDQTGCTLSVVFDGRPTDCDMRITHELLLAARPK